MDNVSIEVACALPHKQRIIALEVPVATTYRQAVLMSGLAQEFPDIDLAQAPLGCFGEVVSQPESTPVTPGCRVEVYRPLVMSPRAARQLRAQRASD
jgi:putative ubiquitin-RnfH superfamily antitoxin RatB of RatAB toxin-antitoxin module